MIINFRYEHFVGLPYMGKLMNLKGLTSINCRAVHGTWHSVCIRSMLITDHDPVLLISCLMLKNIKLIGQNPLGNHPHLVGDLLCYL